MKKILPKMLTLIFVGALVITSTVNIDRNLQAQAHSLSGNVNELGIDSSVSYSSDNTSAALSVDMSSLDTEKYEVKQILGPNGEALDLISPSVNVSDNGDYLIKVQYIDKTAIVEVTPEVEPTPSATEPVVEPVSEGVLSGEVAPEETPEVAPVAEEVVEQPAPVTVVEPEIKEVELATHVNGIADSQEVGQKEVTPVTTPTAENSRVPSLYALQPDPSKGVELAGQFDVSAFASNSSSSNGWDISPQISSTIVHNYMKPTLTGIGSYIATSLTSKYTVDFKRSFEMTGYMNQPGDGVSDGILFAFHNSPGYKYKGGYSSNLGLYNYNQSGFQSDALIVEVDTYNNRNLGATVGDHISSPNASAGSHLDILEMTKGVNPNPVSLVGYNSVPLTDMVGDKAFKVVWNAKTGTISVSINGKSISYDGFNVMEKFDTTELYYTIGAASGLSGSWGYNSELLYDGFIYTDFTAEHEAVYTVNGEDGSKKIIPSTDVDDLVDYVKPGETVQVLHKFTNTNPGNLVELSDHVGFTNSKHGESDLLPVDGTLKKFSDIDQTKVDITEDVFNGESTLVSFPKLGEGAGYVEYALKLPDNITVNHDILTTATVGKLGMTQYSFLSNAKVAGSPTLNSAVDLDIALSQVVENVSDAEIKAGLTGHTHDSTADVDLATAQANLELTYVIKTLDGSVVTSIPKNKVGGYLIEYTLKDTRSGSQLIATTQRKIWVADKHISENGIDLISRNFSVNEIELLSHESDFENFIKTESGVKAYWSQDGSEITNILMDSQGLVFNSPAKDAPYPVKFTAEKDSKTASISSDVTVTANVMGYIIIPTYVTLGDDYGNVVNGGTNESSKYIGSEVKVKMKEDSPSTVKGFQIRVQSEFDIVDPTGVKSDKYTVGAYDKSGNKLVKDGSGIAEVGEITPAVKETSIWLNTLKDKTKAEIKYEGTMTFYITSK